MSETSKAAKRVYDALMLLKSQLEADDVPKEVKDRILPELNAEISNFLKWLETEAAA